jgi:holo-[acyl-carrier protein] synthase
MIIGIGVDTVEISRFEKKITETPKLVERLFTADESDAPTRTLAGRFAAKEAVIKALAGAPGIEWHGILVSNEQSGRPIISLSGKTAEIANQQGVSKFHLSITHDGDMAIAFVVAESANGGAQ